MIESVLLGLAFFVCPLLFFTDLTRNPYFSQIALLNILLLAVAAAAAIRFARRGEWSWTRTPLDGPWLAWLGIALLAWGLSWLRHEPFFRPSIASEGRKVIVFTFVNTFLPFWAGSALARREEDRPLPIAWLGLAAAFGAAWTLFPLLRSPAPMDLSALSHVWDPYGGLVWLAGGFGAALLARGGSLTRLFHVALAAALVASAYGVLQYFNVEWVWPKVLNPYGGRSVSTFGNPNFLSTYLVLLAPAVFVHFLLDEKSRWWYGGALVVMWLALLASLTRSSWLGCAVGFAALAAWPGARAAMRKRRGPVLVLAAALAVLGLLWPRSPVEGYRASAVQRLVEGLESLSPAKQGEAYAPWHQRVMIWTCAWQMGLDSPLIGNGWGQFELFYPFYQGPLLAHEPLYRSLRTHANNAHNEVLELFSQTGLAGLGVQAWLWVVFFAMAASTWRGRGRAQEEPKLGSDAAWSWGLASGAAGVLADNLMNVSMHFAVPAFALWWCVGAAAGRAGRWETRVWRPSKPLGTALAAAIAAAGAWGAWTWACQWEREVHYFAGFKLVRMGRLDAAAKELREGFDWHPREVNNDYELGNTLARLGRLDDAVWAYHEALDSNAGYDEIYFNLATVLGPKLNRWAESEDAYRIAAWINPLSKEAATGLAGMYLREPERRFEEARQFLTRAVELFPADASFWNNLGYLYSLRGEPAEAVTKYESALKVDPDFELAERNLRTTMAGKSDPLLAALDGRRALERRIAEKKIDAESLRLAESAAAGFPNDLKSRFYRGSLRLALGKTAESLDDLAWVVARQPSNTAARVNLGRALDAMGRRDEAQAQYREVLRLEPDNAAARQSLSQGT
jgi:tetratricopeptide (TPR) repeat protein/O-antigen ligase